MHQFIHPFDILRKGYPVRILNQEAPGDVEGAREIAPSWGAAMLRPYKAKHNLTMNLEFIQIHGEARTARG